MNSYIEKSLESQVNFIDRTPNFDLFELGGLTYRLVWKDFHKYKSSEGELVILKAWEMLESEYSLFKKINPGLVVEFGIFEGGSTFLWHEILGCSYIGFDIMDENPIFTNIIHNNGWEDSISLYFNTSQDDSEKVLHTLESRTGSLPIDLIIDDASHQHKLTRATFEFMFPALRNGGMYVIEDWNWAHSPDDFWQKDLFWRDNPALTNFIFEAIMISGSNPNWISDINLRNSCAFIEKGINCPSIHNMKIETSYFAQGREFNPI